MADADTTGDTTADADSDGTSRSDDHAGGREHTVGESTADSAETRIDPSGWRGRTIVNAMRSQASTSPLIIPPGQIGSLGARQATTDRSQSDDTATGGSDARVSSITDAGTIREHSVGANRGSGSTTPFGSDRTDLARLLHGQFGTDRDVYAALGYPTDNELSFEAFHAQYRRHPYAKPIVDKPANDTFQDPPIIIDHGRDGYRTDEDDETARENRYHSVPDGIDTTPPQAAQENAQQALDARDDTGNPKDCGTRTGWKRANQLASGESLSEDTIQRIANFGRHESNSDQGDEGRENCGWMMWKAWGGDEAILTWAPNKLDEIERARSKENARKRHSEHGDMSGESEPGKREPVTPFEQAVKRLFDGDTLRRSLIHRITTADRMNRLGRFSTIFFGLRDDREPEERIDMTRLESVREDDGVHGTNELDLDYGGDDAADGPAAEVDDSDGDENDTGADGESDNLTIRDRLARLSYVSVFDEGHAEFDVIDDPTSPRNRLPETYTFDPGNDASDFDAHYSRVIHVAENTLTDDLRSDSVLRTIYNNLEDTLRIAGGSAESLWMGAFPGIVVNPPMVDTANGRMPAQFDDDGESLADQIKNWRHTMSRAFFPNGGEVDTIEPTVADPSPHIDMQLSMLAAGASPTIPRKILIGNQLGDRASKEDRKSYRSNIAGRRENHGESRLIRPIIDRLVTLGVLPEPEGDGYDVEWPALGSPDEETRAETRKTTAEALKNATDAIAAGADPAVVYDAIGLPQSTSYDTDVGLSGGNSSSTPNTSEPEPTIDESDSDVLDQFDRVQNPSSEAD
jgi:hypothetical protein